jgi:hypothetical protein
MIYRCLNLISDNIDSVARGLNICDNFALLPQWRNQTPKLYYLARLYAESC